MNASWADPVGVETIPRGTAHLATQRYPPLPGDAPVDECWYEPERWAAVAEEYRERGYVVVRGLIPPAELAHVQMAVEDYIRDVVPGKDRASVFTPEAEDLSTLQYFASPVESPYLVRVLCTAASTNLSVLIRTDPMCRRSCRTTRGGGTSQRPASVSLSLGRRRRGMAGAARGLTRRRDQQAREGTTTGRRAKESRPCSILTRFLGTACQRRPTRTTSYVY